ncbi:LamG domain-containing protein, partial [candidate division KSB1 bacterium]|nr:LamG domain-containing protein [candidate division KSB1 bacterium]
MPRGTYWPGVSRLKRLASLLLLFTLFQEAHGQNDTRITDGLIAYYPFIEGRGSLVEDFSDVDSTLNLTISGDNVTWLTERNGVSIDSSSIISSIGPASKLFREIVDHGAFSIEIWCKTSDLTQSGPARLVSFSSNPGLRNVTIGQEGDSLFTRLRTTTTSLNGTPNMKSGPILTTDESHIVVTYTLGRDLKLFMDGNELISEPRAGDLSNWSNSYPLIIGNEPTGDRPWLGEVYLVAIYNRELSQDEISQNFGAGSVVETGNREPETPTLVSPDNGTLFNSSSPPLKLEWSVPKDANNDPLHFRIEIAQDTSFNFASIIESRTDVAGFVPTPPVPSGQDTASYSLPSVLADGKYWWRVSAWDGSVYGSQSAPRSFIVDTTPPTGTLANSPAVSAEEDFLVTWRGGTDSGSGLSGTYDVLVQVDNSPWTVWKSNTQDTSATYTGLHLHTYSFEAAAYDRAGNVESILQIAETTTQVDTVAND